MSDYKQKHEDSVIIYPLPQFSLDRGYHGLVSDEEWDNIVDLIHQEFMGLFGGDGLRELIDEWIEKNKNQWEVK